MNIIQKILICDRIISSLELGINEIPIKDEDVREFLLDLLSKESKELKSKKEDLDY